MSDSKTFLAGILLTMTMGLIFLSHQVGKQMQRVDELEVKNLLLKISVKDYQMFSLNQAASINNIMVDLKECKKNENKVQSR